MSANNSTLTQGRLKELLTYNPDTGLFTRRGKPAGSLNDRGYVVIKVDHTQYKAHRLAWLYMKRSWPEAELDRINRNKADNRWANLRECTHAENQQNLPLKKTNTSGYTGVVAKPSGKWKAQIKVRGLTIHIGTYTTKKSAIRARQRVAARLHPFSA